MSKASGYKTSRDKLKNEGKRDAYTYDPENLILVMDEKSPLYDERVHLPVDEGLVKNIMFAPDGVPLGVIEAVTARRNTETGDLEIVNGRQRVKAAREANKRLKKAGLEPIRVSVLIQRGQDHRLVGMLISSNEHRQDDTPLGRAKKAQGYINMGRDEKEVAALFGVSEATVKNMLRLLDAPAAVRNALDSGKISASDAYKLAREEPAEAREKVAKLIEHAPRTPGRKRSQNAKKARQVMGKPEPAAAEPEAAAPTKKSVRKSEDAVAEAIAAWVEDTWRDGNWNGAPSDIPIKIREGDWREHRDKKSAE
jgi:ParB family transcriptional regulator, chromosome partitioning protein